MRLRQGLAAGVVLLLAFLAATVLLRFLAASTTAFWVTTRVTSRRCYLVLIILWFVTSPLLWVIFVLMILTFARRWLTLRWSAIGCVRVLVSGVKVFALRSLCGRRCWLQVFAFCTWWRFARAKICSIVVHAFSNSKSIWFFNRLPLDREIYSYIWRNCHQRLLVGQLKPSYITVPIISPINDDWKQREFIVLLFGIILFIKLIKTLPRPIVFF